MTVGHTFEGADFGAASGHGFGEQRMMIEGVEENVFRTVAVGGGGG